MWHIFGNYGTFKRARSKVNKRHSTLHFCLFALSKLVTLRLRWASGSQHARVPHDLDAVFPAMHAHVRFLQRLPQRMSTYVCSELKAKGWLKPMVTGLHQDRSDERCDCPCTVTSSITLRCAVCINRYWSNRKEWHKSATLSTAKKKWNYCFVLFFLFDGCTCQPTRITCLQQQPSSGQAGARCYSVIGCQSPPNQYIQHQLFT